MLAPEVLAPVLVDSSQQVKTSDCSAQASSCVSHHPSSSSDSRLSRGRPCHGVKVSEGLSLKGGIPQGGGAKGHSSLGGLLVEL